MCVRFFDNTPRQIFRHRENCALLDGVREDLIAVCAAIVRETKNSVQPCIFERSAFDIRL